MEWLKRRLKKFEQAKSDSNKASILAHEVWEAHKDLQVAELKLSEAVEPDQIDYAIYITEAAEKRLNMLIREAREQQLELTEHEMELPEPKKTTLDM